MSYFINGIIDFAVSMSAFAIWTHYDLDGWWRQRYIERGKRREQRG